MKAIYILIIAVLCLSFKNAPADNYTVIAAKSKIIWTGHADAGTYSPTGSIGIKSGSVSLIDNRLVAATMIIDMNTIEHENKDLEHHLKNTDFFDCEKYPEAVFKLLSVDGNVAAGNITIKGTTQKITFPLTIQKQGKQVTMQINMKIDRTKFGIKYNSSSFFQDLGSYAIKNDFDLDIMLVADAK